MSLTKKVLSSLAIVCFSWAFAVTGAHAQQENQSLQRPKVLTPMAPKDLLDVLSEAHVEVNGVAPPRARLAMAYAQVALENAHGEMIWNHNLGNIGPGRSNPYYFHSDNVKYRSFDTFLDGGKMYWRVINFCSRAMNAFDAGQPAQASRQLLACGYFSAAELELYIQIMSSLYEHAINKIIPEREREKHAQAQWVQYQIEHPYEPTCACSR